MEMHKIGQCEERKGNPLQVSDKSGRLPFEMVSIMIVLLPLFQQYLIQPVRNVDANGAGR
jgi:hypothetical protein